MKTYFFLLSLILLISFESFYKKSFAQSAGVNKVMTYSDHYYFHVGRMMAYCRAHAFGVNLNPVFTKVIKGELKSVISVAKEVGISSKELREVKRSFRGSFPDCPI